MTAAATGAIAHMLANQREAAARAAYPPQQNFCSSMVVMAVSHPSDVLKALEEIARRLEAIEQAVEKKA